MIDETANPDAEATLPRIMLRETGWQVGMKLGSDKTFCYQMAPGEDFYHRLHDGEILVHRGDEKLCLPCAERRGLLTFTPRPLREQMAELDVEPEPGTNEYDLKG